MNDNSDIKQVYELAEVPSSLDLLGAEEQLIASGHEVLIVTEGVAVKDIKIDNQRIEDTILLDSISPSSTSEFRMEPSNKVRVWQAKRGSDLKSILIKWSEQENVQFTWEAEGIYRLDYDVFISGTFENAVEVLLSRGLKDSPSYKIETDPYSLNISHDQ